MKDLIELEKVRVNVKYDGNFTIATGKSRKDISWKNREISWSSLLTKLKKSYESRETIDEYLKMSKQKQDEIKDIGGFVGGSLKEGHRKAGNVLGRQLLTLDADFAPVDLWDNIEMLYDFAIACYSTHKHTPEKPRLRLVIPLNREVSPDEYEAIGRKIAEDIGIDYFDDTTYQASRLMYWPSNPKDVEPFFKYIDAPWLDADAVLSRYKDWRDTSFWPESSRAQKIYKKQADKQGNPLDKDGLIGAFCRAYSIEEAIEEFLSDEYIRCDMPGRYTYANGSTAAGLVIYEDMFAYSNHATDPCSGKLCNAFDLVRIHKFGELDGEMPEGTAVTKLPSYNAMLEFAQKDKRTKVEAIQGAKDDFKDPIEENSDDWMLQLECNKKTGLPFSTINNIEIILKNDERIKGCLGYNDLSHRIELIHDAPWRSIKRGSIWRDTDDGKLRGWLEKHYSITGKEKIIDGLSNVAQDKAFHPIVSYLDDLEWDGTPRLDTMLIDYLGADDTPYVRAVTRKQFTACVARVYAPGTKKDEMLVLVGETQGQGKSTLLDIMGGAWFSDSIEDFKGKDVAEGLQGRWIIEVGELDAMKKNEVETVKKFLSKRKDIFRMAYGRRTDEYDRQCVFFGTTNTIGFLRDSTGERRFWPIDVYAGRNTKNVFNDLPNERDQIWAEAKYRYEQGEQLWIEGEVLDAAIEAQRAHKDADPRLGQVIEYLNMKLPTTWSEMSLQDRRDHIHNNQFGEPDEDYIVRDKICPIEVWCELFKGSLDEKSRYDIKMIAQLLKEVPGWEKEDKPKHYGRLYGSQRGFRRIQEDKQ